MTTSTSYTIIWLDRDANDPDNAFRMKLGQNLQTFNEIDDCTQFISSHPCQSIYLVVSGSFAKTIITQIYDLPQLVQIYLFCGSISAHSEWAIDYIDKILMFEHGDDLLGRLWNDIHSSLREKAALFLQEADACKQRATQYRQICG